MKWKQCVLDATMGNNNGLFSFCPIEGDIFGEFEVVTGMNYISSKPPEGLQLVAVIHSDGQEAVERFLQENKLDFKS
jgi:hypothetical protein